MTDYRRAKISWANLTTGQIASSPKPNGEWTKFDSRFEATIACYLAQWCLYREPWKLINKPTIRLTSGSHIHRSWVCDFSWQFDNLRVPPIFIEAKGQCDLRFKDVLSLLDARGDILPRLIVVEKCRETIRRLFPGGSFPEIGVLKIELWHVRDRPHTQTLV
ncbi:hypothetical protein [Roseofilum sp. Belize Diploria]|uniref:hypothetical protein n=1 Tax=Roseofilum sp. Belize Diploria TaxID=2821501 RepID=UPI001B1856E9|nr:hypothetical protein [Roseofilum sp. Belize Diploria]MBP0009404.1 hypothetical protein [Roseofilum sp. Belize Diploria]